MKIIDLLNKISNGEEIPLKIKVEGYEYRQSNGQFWCDKTEMYLIDNCTSIYHLNDEVEILEEEKKMPEKICTNRIINTKDILEFEMIQNKINAEYTYAINEIIDFLKSKGE